MNLREALGVLREAKEKTSNDSLIEYLTDSDPDYACLSFGEVDALESLGVYCWYVHGEPHKDDYTMPMHRYEIGGSK